MCGIAGVIGGPWNREERRHLLGRMASVLAHRGPDDEGFYISPKAPAGLAFRRLSIIDLSTGRQPMCNEDGSVWVVFNGEIYNYRELRVDLERRHVFRTRSDTEVLVHLYEERGSACVNELDGMFAFAVWDERDRSLMLARDRLGKKPLAYYHDSSRFLFASEMKALLQDETLPRELDHEALEYYLAFLYIPAPLSIWKGIRKVEPGHVLFLKNGRVTTHRYWTPRVDLRSERDEVFIERIRHTLSEAVRKRLMADVPLGAFLSGGIDSSIVVGLMARHLKEPVKTYSIGFDEREYDELPYARETARHFRTDHHEFTVKADSLDLLPKLVWHYDEPFGDSSAIPTYYVARETARHVKVALSGDGGDECFGGYTRYKVIAYLARLKRWPTPVIRAAAACAWMLGWVGARRQFERARRLLRFSEWSLSDLYVDLMSFFPRDLRHAILISPSSSDRPIEDLIRHPFEEHLGTGPVTAAEYADVTTYLPFDILVKVDIASMACSLEVRCPFLDHQLVDLALTIPDRLKVGGFGSKMILKRAFADLLPPKILSRGKMGFGVPVGQWMRHVSDPSAQNYLAEACAGMLPQFKKEALQTLVHEHLQGIQDHRDRLWQILWLSAWQKVHRGISCRD